MTSLQRQPEALELMDLTECDPRLLERTYAQFPLVNKAAGGWCRIYARQLRPVLAAVPKPRILDIGCGGGDVLRGLLSAALRDGFDVHGLGIDPDERAVDFARRAAAKGRVPQSRLEFRAVRSHALVRDGQQFDLVVSNHLLHHLGAEEIPELLADSQALAAGAVVHADIRRSRAALLLFGAATLPLAGSSLIRRDGLASIRRSFTPLELAHAAGPGWWVLNAAPYRNLLVWEAQRHG